MASWLVRWTPERVDGPGSAPGQEHCVVFFGGPLYSQGTSLHPGV